MNFDNYGPWCALLSSVTWAIGSSRYSQMTRLYSAFAVNLARALFAFPLFVIAIFISAGSLTGGISQIQALQLSQIGWFALSMIASYGLADVLFFKSTRILGVPTALAIASLFPLWTAAAAWIFKGERISVIQISGLLLAVLGVIFVVLNTPQIKEVDSENGRNLKAQGLGLAFVTSFLWSINSYSVAQGGQGVSAPVGAAVRMVFAMIFCLALGSWGSPKQILLMPKRAIIGSAWVFVLEAFGGSYFYMIGMTHSPLAVGATLTSLAPVISVPIAWAMGLEKFSFYRTLAICMVVLGISFLLSGGLV